MAQAAQQAQMQFQQSQTAALAAQAQESSARATKLAAEAQAVPMELEIDRISAVTRNLREGDQDDKEFERRMRVAETLLKKDKSKVKKMLTDKELTILLDQVKKHLQPQWNRLEELERKMEEWSNAKGEGPKAGKGGSKRLQSAKEDS